MTTQTTPYQAVYIGIDFGTSGCRACAIDSTHRVIAEASLPLNKSLSSQSGHFEQDPLHWWESCLALLDELFKDESLSPRAISINGTSSTLLLCDADGSPITPALMYNDQRGADQLTKIAESAPEETAVHTPSSALAKLLHWQHQGIEAKFALHQADWLAAKLSNCFGYSDENNSLKLGYDPVLSCWPKWIEALVNKLSVLPKVKPVGTKLGELTEPLKQRWKLKQPVSIILGTTDSNAAAVASGINQSGQANTSLGSTLAIKTFSDTAIFSSQYGIYSHKLGKQWLVGGASNSGGEVLLKYFNLDQIKELSNKIDTQQDTALNYYPLLNAGERFPINDAKQQPRLTPRPDSDAIFLQGMLEGIAAIEHQGYLKLETLGAPYPKEVFTSGGGASNKAWTSIRAQQLGAQVSQATHSDAAYGSALIAAGILQGTADNL